ncbi:MAG: cytochrome c biogenesis protein CcsA [Bacteroidota bacterium]
MIQKHWWKALGVVILIYSFTAGMLVPLKPGIVEVAPQSAATGTTVEFKVTGYNSHYKEAEDSLRAWLKMDNEHALGADKINVLDDQHLRVTFSIPEYLPNKDRVKDFSLLLDNTVDGASVLPSAVFVTQDSIDPAMGQAAWVNSPIANLSSKDAMNFPFRNILAEGIRNTYYHVPLWFAMILIFLGSVVYSIRYLRTYDPMYDHRAQALNTAGLLFGILGLVTGSIWAKFTWGAYWNWDVKQNMTAIALLIYLAYFILRNSFEDDEQKARISSVYNLFAFAALIPLIYVIPRLTDSLHPGAGGNPAMGGEDLDNTMRMVFYPAIIGWTLIGLWIANLFYRTKQLEHRLLDL